MAHQQQIDFCQSVKKIFPEFFLEKLVLDIGSLDVNGNNQYLFSDCLYLGVDLLPGINVDLVSKGHDLNLPDESVDTIVSTECFEHDQFYALTLRNIVRMLKPGGLFFFTCATTGRFEHGTRRTSPKDVPFIQEFDEWGDYYKNLSEEDVRRAIDIEAIFKKYAFSVNLESKDLYFWGIKRGNYVNRHDYSFQIRQSACNQHIVSLKQAIAQKDDRINEMYKALAERDEQFNQILSSRSWKITKPFRALSRLMKGEFNSIFKHKRILQITRYNFNSKANEDYNFLRTTSLRAVIRNIYYRLPLPQSVKWRLKEIFEPYFRVALEEPLDANFCKKIRQIFRNSSTIDLDYSPGRERALQDILELLDNHRCVFGAPTHWIALPFLATGGAEKVALNLCRALRELVPTQSVALFLTDKRQIAESTLIPDWVALIIFDDYLMNDSCAFSKQFLLYDLLLALRPSCFHNINSEVAWHLILEKGDQLRRIVPLFASIFAFQFAPDGRTKIGYAANFLEKGIPFLTGLISDNKRFIDDATIEYGLGPELRTRMHVLYQPIEVTASKQRRSRSDANDRPQILWAGRLDAEKGIDLFLKVVRYCTFADFRVFGQGVLDGEAALPTLPNLSYEGPFSSPSQWVERFDFDAFLFTSKWEGLPNIILEVGALGIPVIAPVVGGIGELITNETGYPLPERPTIEDYNCALNALIADPLSAHLRANRLLELIKSRHNWSQYVTTIAKIPGYCDKTSPHRVAASSKAVGPLVSVIVPCFNQCRYLHESVSSLLAACHLPMEIIVVDDGSTDPEAMRYLREVEKLAPRVVRVHRKTNGGLSSARNLGLELSRGNYIQFLDADDLVMPGKIDAQIRQLASNNRFDISICNFLLCDEARNHFTKPEEAITRFDLKLEDFLYRWERGFSIPIHCGLFRREVFEKVRFDTYVQAKEDWLFWTTLAIERVSFGYINGHWAVYRQHENSMRRSYFKMGRSWLQAGLKIDAMLGSREPMFLESAVLWFEQCYKANPNYQKEVVALTAANSCKNSCAPPKVPDALISLSGSIDSTQLLERLRRAVKSQDNPLISVIIPVYNHYEYLETCLGSLAEQGTESLEIVIVNDASPDERVTELMNALSSKLPYLKVITHPYNMGISRSQNDAVAAAKGEFVAFLDCDDALEPGALSVIAKCIQYNPDVDYFFTDRLDVDKDGKVLRTSRYGGYSTLKFRGQKFIRADLLDGMVASHLKVIRRSAYLEAGGCDEDFSGVQDWAIALKIAENKQLHYVNQALYRYRVHASSVSNSDSVAQFRKSNILRRRFAERWLLGSDFAPPFSSERIFSNADFPLSLDQLKEAWQDRIRCVVDVSGPHDISICNFLREFNSYFDEIRWNDPTVPAALFGYLWSHKILVRQP